MVTIEEAVLSHIRQTMPDRTIKFSPLEGVYRSGTKDLYASYRDVLYAVGFSREDIDMNFFEHRVIRGNAYVLPLGVASYIRELESKVDGLK